MDFIEKIGLKLVDKDNGKSRKIYQIKNPDGSPRWIWNADNPKPDFLKFYSASSFKAMLFVKLIRVVFSLKIHHFLFSKTKFHISLEFDHTLKSFFDGNFALFTGTIGPNRKLVLYGLDLNNQPKFLKIALTENSELLVNQEFNNIEKILGIKPVYFSVPNVKMLQSNCVEMDDISKNGKSINYMTDKHFKALYEIESQTCNSKILSGLSIYQESIENLKEAKQQKNHSLPYGLLCKIDQLVTVLNEGNQTINCCVAHMDFTPWNTLVNKDDLSIFDWEMSKESVPLAFDLFHFIIQKGIMVERKQWKQIFEELNESFCIYAKRSDYLKEEDFLHYLRWYLVINISYYLKIYSNQSEWHVQVYWLISTWNQALSQVLQDTLKPRESLIGDLFDYLDGIKYSTIKFPDIDPKKLNPYSDIDICISEKDKSGLIDFLINHPVVSKYRLTKHSFMASVLLLVEDGSTLALDFLWQFKRKEIQFLDAQDVLNNIQKNKNKINVMSESHTKHYLNCFYILNNSKIPEKYKSYFETEERIKSKNELITELKQQSFNKGIVGFKNKLFYLKDCVMGILNKKGIILTFSGVDGAGKSTIIEHTKSEIDKRYRMKTVVIRHRPSILPIISSLKYGKENAEKRSVSSLPRQGNNKSTLSSFVRFLYYFADYFFGQFYIYFKYVLRGYVVLYDRYYFDFINDSVRSNIRLNKKFLTFCYRLLLSPNVNVFLYAEPNVILKRKEELDENTILSLTKDYKELFSNLQKRESNNVYLAIENLEIEKTIQTILNEVSKRLV